jgi:hypothetical protein
MVGSVTIPSRIAGIALAFESLCPHFRKKIGLNTGFILTFQQLPGEDAWCRFYLAYKGELHGWMWPCIRMNDLGWNGYDEEGKDDNWDECMKSRCFHFVSIHIMIVA